MDAAIYPPIYLLIFILIYLLIFLRAFRFRMKRRSRLQGGASLARHSATTRWRNSYLFTYYILSSLTLVSSRFYWTPFEHCSRHERQPAHTHTHTHTQKMIIMIIMTAWFLTTRFHFLPCGFPQPVPRFIPRHDEAIHFKDNIFGTHPSY